MSSGLDIAGFLGNFPDKLVNFIDGLSKTIPHFGVVLTVVLGVLWILVTWQVIKNFDKIKHTIMLMVMTIFEGGRRRSIISFLAEKKIGV